jgi:hypothetical protein
MLETVLTVSQLYGLAPERTLFEQINTFKKKANTGMGWLLCLKKIVDYSALGSG